MYPVRAAQIYNCAVIYPNADSRLREGDVWDHPATAEAVLERAIDFHPTLKTLIGMGELLKPWPLVHRDPVKTFVRGRAAVMGDAAHAMLPSQS